MDAKLTAGSVTLMVYLFLHVRSGTDNGSQEPRLDNWRHFNFSAIDTLVRMSGHPLQVAADGQVSIGPKSAWPDSELLCHAHSFGVRVVAVGGAGPALFADDGGADHAHIQDCRNDCGLSARIV